MIDGILEALDRAYVFPFKASEMRTSIAVRRANGEYSSVASASELVAPLTRHLQDVSHDKHLRVRHGSPPAPAPRPQGALAPRPAAARRFSRAMSATWRFARWPRGDGARMRRAASRADGHGGCCDALFAFGLSWSVPLTDLIPLATELGTRECAGAFVITWRRWRADSARRRTRARCAAGGEDGERPGAIHVNVLAESRSRVRRNRHSDHRTCAASAGASCSTRAPRLCSAEWY